MKIFKTWKEINLLQKFILILITIFVVLFSITFYVLVDTVKAGILVYLILVASIFECKMKKWVKYGLVVSFIYIAITLSLIPISKNRIEIFDPIALIALLVNVPIDILFREGRVFKNLFFESVLELSEGFVFYFIIGAFSGLIIDKILFYNKNKTIKTKKND